MVDDGELSDASVAQVSVSRTLNHSVSSVWDVLNSDEGAELLLGPGARLGEKGHTWESHDGRQGVIRSFHPKEEIRFSWRLKADCAPSLVELKMAPSGQSQTKVDIIHSNLDASVDRVWLTERWHAALERLDGDAS